MRLTDELLARFVGGDMEIQNKTEDYLFRGLIESAIVEDDNLKVHFKWFAKNDSGPSCPTATWTNDDRLDYAVSLMIYNMSDIGDGRICVDAPIAGELIILFPPNGSHLDPTRVAGLVV